MTATQSPQRWENMTTRKPKLFEFFLAGIALAFLVGAVLVYRHTAVEMNRLLIAGVVITLLAYYVNSFKPAPKKVDKPVWVPEAEAGTVPRHGSRRWARANFHSGIISIEELNAFYVTHPEDLSDPDR